ncbi:2-hydroxyacyl-CoA dehydratase family protein [Deltaproteobacteria bacterium TL4]
MQSMIPESFNDLIADTSNPYLDEAKAAGKRLIGYTCSYIPEALLSVEGLVPVRMSAPGVAGTEMADTYLSNVTCSYTRSLLEYAMDFRYEHIDGWVFTASCDHLRRLYDNLVYLTKPAFAYMLDLPHKTTDAALKWYVEELQTLAQSLASCFGVNTGAEALRKSISERNQYLALMRSIGELRKQDQPPLTGTEFHTLLKVGSVTPLAPMMPAFQKIREDLKTRKLETPFRARLMVVGSELDDPGYLHVIEKMGGLIVADRYCTGSIPGLNPIPEKEEDPIRTLAEHKLRKTSCPRMMDNFDERIEEILKTAEEYRVEGIVIQTMKFCDLWGVESSPLVTTLRKTNIPILRLEREYRLSGEGQLKTRIQAFLESMGK